MELTPLRREPIRGAARPLRLPARLRSQAQRTTGWTGLRSDRGGALYRTVEQSRPISRGGLRVGRGFRGIRNRQWPASWRWCTALSQRSDRRRLVRLDHRTCDGWPCLSGIRSRSCCAMVPQAFRPVLLRLEALRSPMRRWRVPGELAVSSRIAWSKGGTAAPFQVFPWPQASPASNQLAQSSLNVRSRHVRTTQVTTREIADE